MKLWTQAIDSKGSTVSQFHSLTKRHGGVGSGMYGGVGKKQGTRDQGSKGTESGKAGNGEAGGRGWGRKTGGWGKGREQATPATKTCRRGPRQGPREQGTGKKLLAPGFWPPACLAESVSREYRNERTKRLKAAFGSWLPVLRAETAALLASLFPRSLGPLAPRSLIPSVPPFWSLFACSLGPLVPVSIIGTSMRQGGVMIGKLVGD